jgi:hypothetical protein
MANRSVIVKFVAASANAPGRSEGELVMINILGAPRPVEIAAAWSVRTERMCVQSHSPCKSLKTSACAGVPSLGQYARHAASKSAR